MSESEAWAWTLMIFVLGMVPFVLLKILSALEDMRDSLKEMAKRK